MTSPTAPVASLHAGAVDAARTLLRAHLGARSYAACLAAAPALVVPGGFASDDDLLAGAALAVAETFGLLDGARGATAAAAAAFVRAGLHGAADRALDRAAPETVLAWCIAAAEWCERNGLDHEFNRLEVRASTADAAAPAWARVHWRVAAAWHHEAFGRIDDRRSLLDAAQRIAEADAYVALRVAVWLHQARLSLACSAPAAALTLAERALAHGDERSAPLWLAAAADVACRAALMQGDMHRALQQARRARGLADLAHAPPSYTMTYRVYEAYALLGIGAWDDAVATAHELATIALPARLTERINLLAQLFALVRDDRIGCWHAGSEEALRRALRRLRELDWPYVFAVLPQSIARLWARALEAGIETDWVLASIRSRDLPPPEPCWPTAWPWPLRIAVLGAFECRVDERDLADAAAGKAAAKPLALLRRLAAAGGFDGVAVDALAVALWRGEGREGREGRDKAFETTLARLRRLLGHADALLLRERRLRLNPQRVWLDSVALARRLDALEAGFDDVGWDQALALWRGPLLADEPAAPWVEELRERQRMRLAAALLRDAERPGHRARCLRAASADPGLLPHL